MTSSIKKICINIQPPNNDTSLVGETKCKTINNDKLHKSGKHKSGKSFLELVEFIIANESIRESLVFDKTPSLIDNNKTLISIKNGNTIIYEYLATKLEHEAINNIFISKHLSKNSSTTTLNYILNQLLQWYQIKLNESNELIQYQNNISQLETLLKSIGILFYKICKNCTPSKDLSDKIIGLYMNTAKIHSLHKQHFNSGQTYESLGNILSQLNHNNTPILAKLVSCYLNAATEYEICEDQNNEKRSMQQASKFLELLKNSNDIEEHLEFATEIVNCHHYNKLTST